MSLPPIRVPHPHVRLEPRAGGSPVVGDGAAWLTVRVLWTWHCGGASVEAIVRQHPGLTLSQVLDGLSFALDNRDVIEADIARAPPLLPRLAPPPPAHRRAAPRPRPRHELEIVRRVPEPPPVIIAEPAPAPDLAAISLTDNQWLELGRLSRGPQPTDTTFRRQLQKILAEKGLAAPAGNRCEITTNGLARFKLGRRPATS